MADPGARAGGALYFRQAKPICFNVRPQTAVPSDLTPLSKLPLPLSKLAPPLPKILNPPLYVYPFENFTKALWTSRSRQQSVQNTYTQHCACRKLISSVHTLPFFFPTCFLACFPVFFVLVFFLSSFVLSLMVFFNPFFPHFFLSFLISCFLSCFHS